MDKIYKKLALHLDKIPNGYPETESGVELKILAKLFSVEEAELACIMDHEPESVGVIAVKAGKEERPVFVLLKTMLKKGLIDMKKEPGVLLFNLIPFVVGFYEKQNAKIDKEFAELFEQYYKEGFYKIMTVSPSVHRVIPVEKTIPVNVDVMPYERASTYLDNAKAWGVLNCICRVQKSLIGEDCGHTKENCVAFSTRAGVFDRSDAIRALTKDEALKILNEAKEEGLVHTINNVQDEVSYICNCCSCSCGVLRGFTDHGSVNSVAQSDFYVKIDEELCTGCENCIGRCNFNALKMKDDICKVDLSMCFGCGLCIDDCPEDALFLYQKEKDQIKAPPRRVKDWKAERIISRMENMSK